MMEWSDDKIISAMHANMHFHMTYFARHLPTMSLCIEPDVTIVMSEIADDTFNYVIDSHFEDRQAEDRISHILQLFKAKALPFSWWVSERDRPHSLSSC
jgi:hypothetical protein